MTATSVGVTQACGVGEAAAMPRVPRDDVAEQKTLGAIAVNNDEIGGHRMDSTNLVRSFVPPSRRHVGSPPELGEYAGAARCGCYFR